MDPISTPVTDAQPEIAYDLRPLLVVHKDGRIQRFMGITTVPPSETETETEAETETDAVRSKDVEISPELSARLYLPKTTDKLPLIIYFHGGGFVIESAKSPTYHDYLNLVAADVTAVIVSVDYRLAPENPLPIAYEDSWSAILWALSLSDPWLSEFADLNRLFFVGDSAGANIAHHMSVRFSKSGPEGVSLSGLVLVHPFFLDNVEPDPDANRRSIIEREFGERFWRFVCPDDRGVDHPFINPEVDDNFSEIAAKKIMVFVAEEDALRDKGIRYVDLLKDSDWDGDVEIFESLEMSHVFHLIIPHNPKCEEMMIKLVEFINQKIEETEETEENEETEEQ